jgi:hypothetical protein
MRSGMTSSGSSPSAVEARRRRESLHNTTRGRCFYCGLSLHCNGERLDRDWFMVRSNHMAVDHATPVKRGGLDEPRNCLPSCARCNTEKGMLTLDEYRLLVGLQKGDFSEVFACEPIRLPRRNWLFAHSPQFEPALVIHNYPASAVRWQGRKLRSKFR